MVPRTAALGGVRDGKSRTTANGCSGQARRSGNITVPHCRVSSPMAVAPVQDIIADLREGRIVILVDEEDRENEVDLVISPDPATPETINLMAKFGRRLISM